MDTWDKNSRPQQNEAISIKSIFLEGVNAFQICYVFLISCHYFLNYNTIQYNNIVPLGTQVQDGTFEFWSSVLPFFLPPTRHFLN